MSVGEDYERLIPLVRSRTLVCLKLVCREYRVIPATATGPITKLATLFVRFWGHCHACRQVWIPPTEEGLWISDWCVKTRQRNRKSSNSEVEGGAIIFRVKRCSHCSEAYEMVSRYWVSMVVRCSPRLLSTRDINIEVPPELYWNHQATEKRPYQYNKLLLEKSLSLSLRTFTLSLPRHISVYDKEFLDLPISLDS